MIHKFWNVRLAPAGQFLDSSTLDSEATEADRDKIRKREEQMEEKVYKIWSILSTFEESSAACISEMLLHVSNGAYVDGVLVAKSFISHVEILFAAIDMLAALLKEQGLKGMYGLSFKMKQLTSSRPFIRARGKAAMQENSCFFLASIKDTRDWSPQAWCYTRASLTSNRPRPLP
jgi:hypothetical protein